jgi:colicin import membrane protein
MSSTLSVNGIGHGILRAPTLRLGGATAKPTAEDEAAKVEQAKKSKGIGKPNPLNQIKDQAEADAAPASEKGSTGNKTLDTLQKAIDMAKRQLELAQKQLRAVEARSKGEGKADEASQAAREAAQANVAAASEALTTAYAAYTEALKKAGETTSGVSARA